MTYRVAIVAGVVLCLFGAISVVNLALSRFYKHANEGPHYSFSLPGDYALSDDAALEYSRQTLVKDGKQLDGWKPIPVAGTDQPFQYYNRGSSGNRNGHVTWNDERGRPWYVEIRREAGRVSAFSYQ